MLDEPSVGLHPRDTDRLLALLRRLRDAGNTVVVVEHDLAAIRQADFMLELGPGSGEKGGRVVHAGPVESAVTSLTGQYLTGQKRIAVPSARRPAGPRWLRVRGATLHNLKDVNADIPLGTLTAVTGVSGSGKSTLLYDVIYRNLEARMHGGHSAKTHLGEPVGQVASLTGWELLQDVLLVDQSPIGRSPRSNPITYIKAFDEIRELFAAQPLARQRKYSAATFSFNLPGGRCDACEGAGHVQVEMVFLADVFVPCEVCGATRYRRDVLDVRIQGNSIHDVLQWTVDEAIARFRHQPKLGTALWQLQQVGLGYLRLGQPATTLSGGEAQRLKIARELLAGRQARGTEALHPRRADHRAPSRRRAGAHPGARPAGGRGTYGRRHRAPPGCDQAGGLDRRPGPGGRRRRRPRRGPGHARGGGRRWPDRTPAATSSRCSPSSRCRRSPADGAAARDQSFARSRPTADLKPGSG